jgi:hypothetical protein
MSNTGYIERSMNQAIAMHTANVSCTEEEEEIEELDEKARRLFLKTGHYEPENLINKAEFQRKTFIHFLYYNMVHPMSNRC